MTVFVTEAYVNQSAKIILQNLKNVISRGLFNMQNPVDPFFSNGSQLGPCDPSVAGSDQVLVFLPRGSVCPCHADSNPHTVGFFMKEADCILRVFFARVMRIISAIIRAFLVSFLFLFICV